MKKAYIFILLFFTCIYNGRSQNNVTHPTIQNVRISYKAESLNSQSIQSIQGFPTATINLNTGITASVIHFKISDATTNDEIYQVSYNVASSPVTNNGKTLFQNNSGVILITYDQAIRVLPHKYEIWTEDAQHNASTILSLTK